VGRTRGGRGPRLGSVVVCRRAGIVDTVDARRIIVRVEARIPRPQARDFGADIYQLTKFRRSNQNTCMNQKPIVRSGQRVVKARSWPTVRTPTKASWRSEGTCSSRSCRGAGTTSRTPSWCRRSSSRRTTSPRSTSRSWRSPPRHQARPEEITRDIPNVSEAALRDLDEAGSSGRRPRSPGIDPGRQGDAEGETQLTPERSCCARSSREGRRRP